MVGFHRHQSHQSHPRVSNDPELSFGRDKYCSPFVSSQPKTTIFKVDDSMIPRHVDCLTGALHTARIEVQYPLGDSPHHLRKAQTNGWTHATWRFKLVLKLLDRCGT